MMIPEFIRFYGYTLNGAFNEYAISFFSLLNSMYRLQAIEMLDNITAISAANSGDTDIVTKLEKKSKGISSIIDEVKVVKSIRGET